MMNSKDHVTVLGVLHIAWSALMLAAAVVVMAVFTLGSLSAEGEEFSAVLIGIALLASAMLVVFAGAGVIGGVGILRKRRWARYLLMVLGAVWAIKVPVGTALGVYTFYALTRAEVVEMLS